MDIEKNLLIVPRGRSNSGKQDIRIDLSYLAAIEKRKKEVAYVNKETAPELMHVFNEGYCEVNKIIVSLSLEYNQALEEVEERKAVLLLDIIPEELKKRNLVTAKSPLGSEDIRKALMQLDKELKSRIEKAETIKAAHQLLKIKSKGIEMAYQALKKIYDPYQPMPDKVTKLNHDNKDDEDMFT